MPDPTPVEKLATDLLTDVEVALGYGRPIKPRRIFDFLQPHYDRARDEDVVDRIVDAFNALDSDDKRELFRQSVLEAIERCATTWLGTSRTLSVAILAHRIARELLPSGIWARLLERTDPESISGTAVWIERLVRALRAWGVRISPTRVNWLKILKDCDISSLPIVAEWVLGQLDHMPDLSKKVFEFAVHRIAAERIAISADWPDPNDVIDLLQSALLPSIDAGERRRFLRGIEIPSVEIDIEKLRRESLSGIDNAGLDQQDVLGSEIMRGEMQQSA